MVRLTTLLGLPAKIESQSFHYHGNAETYMLVGEATGKAMVEMVKP